MTARNVLCSWCGHAHTADCTRTVTTRHGDQPCPCTRHHQGDPK